MNKEKFNIWLRALKSGEYTRGVNQLRRANYSLLGKSNYCCLGVACDLAAKDLSINWDGDTFDGASLALPDSVAQWLGLTSVMSTGYGDKYFYVIDENGKKVDICNLNDWSKADDFSEVIAALERTFPDLVEENEDNSIQEQGH